MHNTEFMFLIISLSKEIREVPYINLGIANVLPNWILSISSVRFLHCQQLKDLGPIIYLSLDKVYESHHLTHD